MSEEKEIFDKKFVHFMWDDSLEGKEGFFSDSIPYLIAYVEDDAIEECTIAHKGCANRNCKNDTYQFNNVKSGNSYLFFYYDPLYEVKLAWKNGKQIQCKLNGSPFRWEDCIDKPNWLDTCEYRVKPEEPKKKWRPFKDIQELKDTWYKRVLNDCEPILFIEPMIWVREKQGSLTRMVHGLDYSRSLIDIGHWCSLEYLFNAYEFLNGTPCGVEEVE